MNECPKCGKIYQDQTQIFCLEDGEKLVSENSTVSIPTVVVLPRAKPVIEPIKLAPEKKSSVKYYFALATAAVLIFVSSIGVMGFLFLRNKVSSNSTRINLDGNSQKNIENSNISQPQSVTPTPQPTVENSVDAVIKELNTIPINFLPSQTTVAPESKPNLEKIAEKLKAMPNGTVIEIGVHTDNVGANDLNMTLSMNRAFAIANSLVALGVKSEMLAKAGYGGNRPIAPNDTLENRAKNRRIEFTLVKAAMKNSNDSLNSDSAMIDLTNPSEVSSLGEDIKIITEKSSKPSKPNPLVLVLTIDKQGNLKLNSYEMGNISDPEMLIKKLREVFEDRNTEKIDEKTVFISVSTRFNRDILTKAIKALKDAGAKPIGIFPNDN